MQLLQGAIGGSSGGGGGSRNGAKAGAPVGGCGDDTRAGEVGEAGDVPCAAVSPKLAELEAILLEQFQQAKAHSQPAGRSFYLFPCSSSRPAVEDGSPQIARWTCFTASQEACMHACLPTAEFT